MRANEIEKSALQAEREKMKETTGKLTVKM
jgi:hypothetical protein